MRACEGVWITYPICYEHSCYPLLSVSAFTLHFPIHYCLRVLSLSIFPSLSTLLTPPPHSPIPLSHSLSDNNMLDKCGKLDTKRHLAKSSTAQKRVTIKFRKTPTASVPVTMFPPLSRLWPEEKKRHVRNPLVSVRCFYGGWFAIRRRYGTLTRAIVSMFWRRLLQILS